MDLIQYTQKLVLGSFAALEGGIYKKRSRVAWRHPSTIYDNKETEKKRKRRSFCSRSMAAYAIRLASIIKNREPLMQESYLRSGIMKLYGRVYSVYFMLERFFLLSRVLPSFFLSLSPRRDLL